MSTGRQQVVRDRRRVSHGIPAPPATLNPESRVFYQRVIDSIHDLQLVVSEQEERLGKLEAK